MLAAAKGQGEVVKVLVGAKANVECVDKVRDGSDSMVENFYHAVSRLTTSPCPFLA